jgi:hypothetical protein
MWQALDCRDHALVRFAQRELWREAAQRRLALEARGPRPSALGRLTGRFGPARREADPRAA